MDRVILGGDHLGPLTFAHYDEEKAEWVMMKGKAKVYAASSSADVRMEKTIKL